MSRVDLWTGITTRFYAWREGLGTEYGGVAALIAERPTSITVTRLVSSTRTTLTAQTVRIDLDGGLRAQERIGSGVSAAQTSKQRIVILGYKNHPTITNTDLQFGDTFKYDGQSFVVRKIEMGFTDRVLAEAEAEG